MLPEKNPNERKPVCPHCETPLQYKEKPLDDKANYGFYDAKVPKDYQDPNYCSECDKIFAPDQIRQGHFL